MRETHPEGRPRIAANMN